MKCSWIYFSYVKEVGKTRVRDINFTPGKKLKADRDATLDGPLNISEANKSPLEVRKRSKIVPFPSEEEMNSFYAELSGCKFKPIAFSPVAPLAESFVQKSREIPTVNDLSDPKYQDLECPELLKQEIKNSDDETTHIENLEPSHGGLTFSNTELEELGNLKESKPLIQTLYCLHSLIINLFATVTWTNHFPKQ